MSKHSEITKRYNDMRHRAQLLRRYAGKIARCHSGRLGRVTNVKIGKHARPIFIGHQVDPPGTVLNGVVTKDWTDWNIAWQSVKPVWVT